MKDTFILHANLDKELIKKLKKELELRGARVGLKGISNTKSLNSIISKNLRKHSSILIFLTKNLFEMMIKDKTSIKSRSKKILPLSFKLNKKNVKKLRKHIKKIIKTKSRSISSYAVDVIKEMSNEKRSINLKYSNKFEDIWDSPFYLYQKKEGLSSKKEVLVDVTWSAKPTRPEMAPALSKSLRQVFEHIGKERPLDILDFGAGKLRHTVILLEEGHNVTAVEYPEIFNDPNPMVKENMEKTENHGGFNKITYPNELAALKKCHDLVMLVNVTDIIPEPLERVFVLDQCNKKLKKNKYLLWFTQHGDTGQRETASDYITDGGCTEGHSRKTFYTEFNKDTVDLMTSLLGFKRESIRLDSGGQHAWLYKKVNEPLIDVHKIAKNYRKVIKRKIYTDVGDEAVITDLMNSELFITLGDILRFSLDEINTKNSKKTAHIYEKIMEQIIKFIFRYDFRPPAIKRQYWVQNGKLRIDIRSPWKESSPLKHFLNDNNLKSTWVPIECKNYTTQIGNDELGQILTRHHKKHRHFGIITCRKIKNDERDISEKLHNSFNAHGYLDIVLDDEDIKYLLKLRDEEESKPPWNPGDKELSEGDMIREYIKVRMEETIDNNKRKKSSELYKHVKSL